jgi:hypothetical protein
LHLALHLSRLRQKKGSNLEIGLRYDIGSLIDIESPPCDAATVPATTRPQGHNTK